MRPRQKRVLQLSTVELNALGEREFSMALALFQGRDALEEMSEVYVNNELLTFKHSLSIQFAMHGIREALGIEENPTPRP